MFECPLVNDVQEKSEIESLKDRKVVSTFSRDVLEGLLDRQLAWLTVDRSQTQRRAREISEVLAARIVSELDNAWRDTLERAVLRNNRRVINENLTSSRRDEVRRLAESSPVRNLISSGFGARLENVLTTHQRFFRRGPPPPSFIPRARTSFVAREEIERLASIGLVSSSLASSFRETLESVLGSREAILGSRVRRTRFDRDVREAQSGVVSEAVCSSISQLQEQVLKIAAELSELKRMQGTSLDVVLDVQRSIRQEVAASLAALSSSDVSVAAGAGSFPSGQGSLKPGCCVVCCERPIDAMFYRCGHVCTCFMCASSLRVCTICRAPVAEVCRVYFP